MKKVMQLENKLVNINKKCEPKIRKS